MDEQGKRVLERLVIAANEQTRRVEAERDRLLGEIAGAVARARREAYLDAAERVRLRRQNEWGRDGSIGAILEELRRLADPTDDVPPAGGAA